MGAKNRDRYTIDDWRAACPSVAAMRRAKWLVLVVCPVCDLQIEADLKTIEQIKGPTFSLWGQAAPCRRRYCHGAAEFFVQPPGANIEIRMTAALERGNRKPPP